MTILRDASIRENGIEPALLPSDLFEEAIQVAEIRHIPLHAGCIVSDLLHRRSQFGVAAACNEDIGAFINKPFCSSQPNAAIAASDQCNFPVKLAHRTLLASAVSHSADRRIRHSIFASSSCATASAS